MRDLLNRVGHAALVLALVVMFTIGRAALAGLPDNGLPDNGLPDNGLPDNGLPDNGLPDNGNSPDALINSPLFFNRAIHSYWVSHPFTATTLNDPQGPLEGTLSDPFSALVMAYQWQLCHPSGDDATVVDGLGHAHTFHGLIGLCERGDGHGWHSDTGLDYETARWLSAATITQVNRYQVHNRYSLRGHTPGGQLTAMSPTLTSYIYYFGTDQPVAALGACPPGQLSAGLADCGWKPHFVGTARAGSKIRISADSHGVRTVLQVNLGIHADDPGGTAALAVSGSVGVVNPTVEFVVPAGGTFNVQWAADPRVGSSTPPPALSAHARSGGGTVRFPADEVFVFGNREMYATAMLFNLVPGDANIAAIPGVTDSGAPVADCEPVVNRDGVVRYVAAGVRDEVIACRRTPRNGQVVFPNAHMWLSSSWTDADDYYRLRSCSSDASTCVATFEGFIDARYCGASDPHCLDANAIIVSRRCGVQSIDRDTTVSLPYPGAPRRLFDAFQCHIGAGPDTGFGVTTFFANYGSQGACWATRPGDPACQYASRLSDDEDDDDRK